MGISVFRRQLFAFDGNSENFDMLQRGSKSTLLPILKLGSAKSKQHWE